MMLNEHETTDRERLIKEVDLALAKIKSAENMLNFMHEPELVESAILEMESARKRYNYLLKKIKSCQDDMRSEEVDLRARLS